MIKERGAPWSAGHDGANTTVRLSVVGKNDAHRGFPAESSFKGWSTGCAMSKRSSDATLSRLVCTEEVRRARWSYGSGVGKTEEEKGERRRRSRLNQQAKSGRERCA